MAARHRFKDGGCLVAWSAEFHALNVRYVPFNKPTTPKEDGAVISQLDPQLRSMSFRLLQPNRTTALSELRFVSISSRLAKEARRRGRRELSIRSTVETLHRSAFRRPNSLVQRQRRLYSSKGGSARIPWCGFGARNLRDAAFHCRTVLEAAFEV